MPNSQQDHIIYFQIVVSLKDLNITDKVTLEVHEPGQSGYNSEHYLESTFTYSAGQADQVIFKARRDIKVSTPAQQCHEDNDHSSTECVNKIMMDKLQCQLPWIDIDTNYRICDKPEDMTKYMDYMKQLDMNELYGTECFVPNCESASWSVAKSYEDTQEEKAQPNSISVYLLFQRNLPVTVHRYSLAYGFSNFVADFGGYLGLLLGASLLSLYDDIIMWLDHRCTNTNQKS